ncbi:9578_t:CDS:2 [Scutellospora calospora]|uniref:9578_t:CDS:1 n=1 Tax=Scutellospora calospora TaxID=85575 RepID=A0ACA9LIH1_9GLOM|nr:9578_t:CDS:2 [Scutellospora calospora]
MLRNQEILCTENKVEIFNDLLRTEWKEPEVLNEESKEITENNNSNFNLFLKEVRSDYQNADQLLRTALDKFKDHYNSAKSKSVSWLSSFLYDMNHNLDSMVHIKSGAHICVQVESIKRHSIKQKLAVGNKENKHPDPHIIPA